MSSINSASSPSSVLLNSSQTLSSGSPALCCPWNAAVGLFLLGSPAPHQPHITGRRQSCLHHHSLFSRGFLQDFLLSYLKASCVQGANAELILQNTNTSIQFLFLFCITAVKSVKPLEQSFSCPLGYSNERERQSKADHI